MNVTTIGLDIAKSVFHLVGAQANGEQVLKKRLRCNKVLEYFGNLARVAATRERPAISPIALAQVTLPPFPRHTVPAPPFLRGKGIVEPAALFPDELTPFRRPHPF